MNLLVGIAGLVLALPLVIALMFLGKVLVLYLTRALYLRGGPRLPVVSWTALIAREALAQARIVAWHITRRGDDDLVGPSADLGDERVIPVVLAHGLAADGTSMSQLRQALIEQGRTTYAPHLGPMFRPLERYGQALAQAIDRALAAHPHAHDIDVVAHSMGGIALRACLRARPDLALRVRRVVTIASPHAGTRAATHLPTTEARVLYPGAPWLLALPSLRALLPSSPITTVCSRHDAVVYPHETCRVEGANHHVLDQVGHAELLVHRSVVELVQAALA